MDITDALAPASDQLDAIELVSPRTFTIDTGSRLGQREGKTVAEIRLVDFPRVWRPSKGMLDALVAAWKTTDATQWVGHSLTLYNDPEVMFGREKTGGVRVSHVSHIDKPMVVTIRAGSGRTKPWRLQPLTETAPAAPKRAAAKPAADAPTRDQLAAIGEAFTAAGITDNDAKAKFLTDTVGRVMQGWGDLTATDAVTVLDALKALTPTDPDPWATTQAAVNARDEQEAS